MNEKISITGLLIAAGLSSRMEDFKPLLTYKNKSFLLNIIEKLTIICDEIVVVTGHNAHLIENELTSISDRVKIKTVFNENYHDGMFTSLQTGIKFSRNQNWILYHFVDQPGILETFYKQIISEIDYGSDWIQPVNQGKKGHPILLGKKSINEILSSPANSTMKQISVKKKLNKKYFESITEAIFFDVDTKSDYQNLIKQKL